MTRKLIVVLFLLFLLTGPGCFWGRHFSNKHYQHERYFNESRKTKSSSKTKSQITSTNDCPQTRGLLED